MLAMGIEIGLGHGIAGSSHLSAGPGEP